MIIIKSYLVLFNLYNNKKPKELNYPSHSIPS